jgi:four helix bundle protein
MTNFHEHKLWQDAFVCLMDIHDLVEDLTLTDSQEDIVEELLNAARDVASQIADGLSRLDGATGRALVTEAIGLVAITRTQLAVSWGRGILNDDAFRAIDTKYAQLSESLQKYK